MNNNNVLEMENDEDDALELARSQQMKDRTRPHQLNGQKRPAATRSAFIDDEAADDMDVEDEEAADMDQPDLPDYFSQWDIPVEDVISMCRSYANYLTKQERAGKPELKGKRFK